MKIRCDNWFLVPAGTVLLATGLAKLGSALGTARALGMTDPIIGVSFRKLILAVGAAELVIALLCVSTLVSRRSRLALIAWLSTSFLVYRLGLWSIGWHHPCGCMGNLAGVLHLSDHAADNIMKGVLAYLLIGSFGILFWQWRQRRAQARTAALAQANEPTSGT
jgi:hypothetical protein